MWMPPSAPSCVQMRTMTEENWSYHLNAAEQEVLARKMEAFCQQQNGMSLRDFARQLQEEPGPTPQMQM